MVLTSLFLSKKQPSFTTDNSLVVRAVVELSAKKHFSKFAI